MWNNAMFDQLYSRLVQKEMGVDIQFYFVYGKFLNITKAKNTSLYFMQIRLKDGTPANRPQIP